MYNRLQPGDYVFIQFGHNDMGPIHTGKARAAINGIADSSHVYLMEATRRYKVIYTFGWYLRKFVQDVREKGATPILVSFTPRNEWPNGKIERRNNSAALWTKQVAEQTGCIFVDLHNLTADYLDKKGQKKAAAYYKNDHTHLSKKGAELNAKLLAKGLKAAGIDLTK